MNSELINRVLDDELSGVLPPEGGPWRRVYGRNAPGGLELVYEGQRGAVGARVVHVPSDGRAPMVRLWRDDPALPALLQLKQSRASAVPVRYRPGKRCTLRLNDLFLKCVADDRGAQINRDARLLWQAGKSGQLDFGIARPAGWLPGLRMFVQHRVSGVPVVERLASTEGTRLARTLGEANASLANAAIIAPTRFTYADQMKRTVKYARRLSQWVSGAETAMGVLMIRLAEVEHGPADRPIHGAPHAHQWLDGPEGLMLVDFDRFALGDPELDAATFAAEADFEDASHFRASAEAYLAGYDSRRRLNPQLVLAYRVHKHVAKALRTATAVRRDANERTLAILAQANRMMENGA